MDCTECKSYFRTLAHLVHIAQPVGVSSNRSIKQSYCSFVLIEWLKGEETTWLTVIRLSYLDEVCWHIEGMVCLSWKYSRNSKTEEFDTEITYKQSYTNHKKVAYMLFWSLKICGRLSFCIERVNAIVTNVYCTAFAQLKSCTTWHPVDVFLVIILQHVNNCKTIKINIKPKKPSAFVMTT